MTTIKTDAHPMMCFEANGFSFEQVSIGDLIIRSLSFKAQGMSVGSESPIPVFIDQSFIPIKVTEIGHKTQRVLIRVIALSTSSYLVLVNPEDLLVIVTSNLIMVTFHSIAIGPGANLDAVACRLSNSRISKEDLEQLDGLFKKRNRSKV